MGELDKDGNDVDAHVVRSKIYKEKQGWMYDISIGDGPAYIHQDFHPEKPGFVPMTEPEAKALAAKLVAAHQKVIVNASDQ